MEETRVNVVIKQGDAVFGDPDPQDLHVVGPPGSRSGSVSQRYGSGSGSFPFFRKELSRVQRF